MSHGLIRGLMAYAILFTPLPQLAIDAISGWELMILGYLGAVYLYYY